MTAATRYAKALFQLAQEQRQLDALTTPVALLAEALRDTTLHHALSNPKLSSTQRADLAADLAKAVKAPALLAQTLGVLAQKHRLALLPEMLDAFQQLAEQHAGIIRLSVQSAEPLTADQRQRLEEIVMKDTGSTGVIFHETTQSDLIAGFRASFAGKVWDTSLSGGLARLRSSLTKRFQHTI